MVCIVNYKNQIKIFDNIDILAEEFSSRFVSEVNSFSKNKRNINIALSGGNTPKYFFRKLVKLKEKLEWERIHFFWGDERCVPTGNPESNFGIAKEYLLDHINIPPDNLNRIMGEGKPEDEAERYSGIVKDILPGINGLPSFDIVILGLGEDGHTASIFPHKIELINSENIYEVVSHPVTKQKRITLTGKVINNSGIIFLLVSGKSKSSVVSEILNEQGNYFKYPAYYIKPFNGNIIWFLDKEAASDLTNNF
jgi:6-phosphogluconolactonase